MRRPGLLCLLAACALSLPGILNGAQHREQATSVLPGHGDNRSITQRAEGDRVTQFVDELDRVPLPGNKHPMARDESDLGALPFDQQLDSVLLLLRPSVEQDRALTELLAAQQDGTSPLYHHWVTPQEFGARFGVSAGDLTQIEGWLGRHGLRIDAVPAGGQTILFSGSAAQVEFAFHTSLRQYRLGGAVHFANASDPEIPAALVPVIEGVVSLNDFRSKGMHAFRRIPPNFTTAQGYHYLAPRDFASIYNVTPLYDQGFNGQGAGIAVVARSNVSFGDLRAFRSSFSLPPRDPLLMLPGAEPGLGSSDDQAEATLDVEWAGAMAPSATVLLVPSASTASTDGVMLSAQYIVSHNLAPIVSMSYALCEPWLGAAGNSFYQRLWQQAAAQGMTVLVSAGDSGAAGCDSPRAGTAVAGLAINGICSTLDSTCIGGTEFDDTASPDLYWNALSDPAHGSARGYIPEMVWNESAGTMLTQGSGTTLGFGLWSGGGGRSTIYAKPEWQSGPGIAADGTRDVPDLAFSASAHDGYLVTLNGESAVFNGTSVAVPAFAGLMALVVQSTGVAQGNINPTLYAMARLPGFSPVLHDVTGGSNSVPGLAGYTAATGYDLASGLGSVDAQALVSNWSLALKPPTLRLGMSQGAVRLIAGTAASYLVTVATDKVFDQPLTVGISGLPTGVFGRYAPVSTSVPGTTLLTLSSVRGARPGTYSVRIFVTPEGAPQSVLQANSFSLTVVPWRPVARPPHLPWPGAKAY